MSYPIRDPEVQAAYEAALAAVAARRAEREADLARRVDEPAEDDPR